MTFNPWALVVTLLSVAAIGIGASAKDSRPPAVPVDGITAVIEAFRSHRIVAISDGVSHGDEQNHAFRLALIRDPRFATVANDIVVEFGSGQYQDVMDRFEHGENVPYSTFRQVWQNTANPRATWDTPIYEEFFRAVRDVNASLPPSRQLRVILASVPFDWTDVEAARVRPFDGILYSRDLVQREILAKHRRALVVSGSAHLRRKVRGSDCRILDGELPQVWDRAKVFSVFQVSQSQRDTLQPGAAWVPPSLAVIRGTSLGAHEDPSTVCGVVRNGKPDPEATRTAGTVRLEDQFDAVLYLGSRQTVAQLSPAICADPNYLTMRLGRLAAFGFSEEVDQLKRFCAQVAR